MSSTLKSRNFRRRGDSDDSGEVDNGASFVTPSVTGRKVVPGAISATKPNSSSKPKKLLSFADDDEEGEAQTAPQKLRNNSSRLKGSVSSGNAKPQTSAHKLISSKDRLPSALTSTTSNVQPQAGTYTKEALLELQKNMRTLAKPSSTIASASGGGIASAEPRVILKGPLKPADDVVNDEDEEYDDEAKPAMHGLSGIRKDISGIPDEDTIKKIRAKRERLRQARIGNPDFIPLESGGGTSGLIRGKLSDEEEDDGDDVDDAMPVFKTDILDIGKKDKSLQGPFEVVDSAGKGNAYNTYAGDSEDVNGFNEDEDEDEEDKLWEEEQFRKGLGKRMDGSHANRGAVGNAVGTGGVVAHNYHRQPQQPLHQRAGPNIGGTFSGYYGVDALSIPHQAEIAMKALQESVVKLKESHGRTLINLAKADENLSSSLMNITSLEKSLSAAGEKFIFMQKLRDFVSVLCEFLQHKGPFIEELEDQMQKLREQRASAVTDRRSADNDDEMLEIEASVKAAKLVFSEHGNSSSMIDIAAKAAQAASASAKERLNLPVKLDDFGRDLNHQKRLDAKRRAEARQRRRSKYDKKRSSSMEVDGLAFTVEGESSTDESDSEALAYESNRELLLQTANQIFSDASEEFSRLSVVKQKFEGWKKEYGSSYRDAYMTLSAPAIFSPYVRLELLNWDPLRKNTDFFAMAWHSLLFDYGMEDANANTSESADPDSNLVPELVEKVAMPILLHEISYCWDIFSTRQTQNAVSATSSVISYIQTSSEALAELLNAVRNRLSDAVAALTVPTWSPHILTAVPSARSIAAYRFGMSIRLLKSIGLWKDIIATSVLEKLALDEVLCGKILPHLHGIASNIHEVVTRTERVVASLAGVWIGTNVIGDHRKKLRPLVEFVLSVCRALEKKHSQSLPEAETGRLARRLKRLLVMLDDYDSARLLARTFHLREAL